MINKTLDVMINAPVRTIVGKVIVRQCIPKLRYIPRPPLSTLSSLDIEMRIRHNLRLIRITRGL